MQKYHQDKVDPVFSSRVEDFEVRWQKHGESELMLRHNKNFSKNKRPSQFSNHTKEAENFKIYKPFDPQDFNFNKTSEKENVLKFVSSDSSNSVIKVNISPIFPSHLVLVPHVEKNLPQYLQSDDLLSEALTIFHKVKSPEYIFLGYNSIGGFSTINHLHFQLFDVRAVTLEPSLTSKECLLRKSNSFYTESVQHESIMPIEVAEGVKLQFGYHKARDDTIYQAFSYGISSSLSKLPVEQVKKIAQVVMVLVDVLHQLNQPYNLLIRDNVIHVVPRQIESKVTATDEFGFGPAMVELFGIFIVKHPEIWQKHMANSEILSQQLLEVMKEKVSLSKEEFDKIKKLVIESYNSRSA